jgi:hypothetical protein
VFVSKGVYLARRRVAKTIGKSSIAILPLTVALLGCGGGSTRHDGDQKPHPPVCDAIGEIASLLPCAQEQFLL